MEILKTFIYLINNICIELCLIWFLVRNMETKGNDEYALGLVKLYVEEVARLGLKRKLDLDSIINAYLYTLARLNKKSEEMGVFDKIAEDEIKLEKTETKKELLKE